MRVVIDSNVIVSAALRGRRPEIAVDFAAFTPEIEWCATPELLREYAEVLSRPRLKIGTDALRRWNVMFRDRVVKFDSTVEIDFPPDPADAIVLVCALSCRATYLVTGDSEVLALQRVGGTRIISPADFVRAVVDPWNSR